MGHLFLNALRLVWRFEEVFFVLFFGFPEQVILHDFHVTEHRLGLKSDLLHLLHGVIKLLQLVAEVLLRELKLRICAFVVVRF